MYPPRDYEEKATRYADTISLLSAWPKLIVHLTAVSSPLPSNLESSFESS